MGIFLTALILSVIFLVGLSLVRKTLSRWVTVVPGCTVESSVMKSPPTLPHDILHGNKLFAQGIHLVYAIHLLGT